MLVQIPNTSEAVDGKNVYRVFNIHINGGYHCSLRYSQLLAFYNEVHMCMCVCVYVCVCQCVSLLRNRYVNTVDCCPILHRIVTSW